MTTVTKDGDFVFCLVRNIPKSLHSRELRAFFSEFIETGKLNCFHFLHRTEVKFQTLAEGIFKPESNMCVCPVKISKKHRHEFVKKYNMKPWSLGKPCCQIQPFPLLKDMKDVETLEEMRPPLIMPQGNVGTPTNYFQEQIRQCKIPSSIISKLGLKFKSAMGRKYSNVPFKYDTRDTDTEESGSDDDRCEEWERHEALDDDPSNQERLGERLFEEPLEVTWDKGSSGLVFYTDAQYWDEMAGDFDEKTADDVDVDMSVYYEGWEAGDLDARQRIEMAESDRREGAAYNIQKDKHPPNSKKIPRERSRSPIASTSKPVSGFGKELLLKSGWKPGVGLGRQNQGISVPIEADGQGPRDRIGFGYRGAKLDVKKAVAAAKEAAEHKRPPSMIATVFDKPHHSKDPGLFRRNDHYTLKHNTDPSLPTSSSKPSGSTGISGTDFR